MRMNARGNWLEPALRIYLFCAVGAFGLGCLFHLTLLKLLGGILLAGALFVFGAAGVYLSCDSLIRSRRTKRDEPDSFEP